MKKALGLTAVAGTALVTGSQALAQASSDLGVDTDTMLTGAATDIGEYAAWGIGLSIAVIAIWKVKKYFTKAG